MHVPIFYAAFSHGQRKDKDTYLVSVKKFIKFFTVYYTNISQE
jgi:hypothetical protein